MSVIIGLKYRTGWPQTRRFLPAGWHSSYPHRKAHPMQIRPETPSDHDAIRQINIDAFAIHAYSSQTEHLIVESLRAADALSVSLVAEIEGNLVGHIAFSHAEINGSDCGWFLLGPVAVFPNFQKQGIGSCAGQRRAENHSEHGRQRLRPGRRPGLLPPFRFPKQLPVADGRRPVGVCPGVAHERPNASRDRDSSSGVFGGIGERRLGRTTQQ